MYAPGLIFGILRYSRRSPASYEEGWNQLDGFRRNSKAFDIVCFKTVVTKMHTLGFSNEFLTWMVHYLSDRRQFVQIDYETSSIETVLFGVPQGSILGPFIFNLDVSDLHKYIKCPCYQYADDTTFFVHSKTKYLANDAISRLGDYSIWIKPRIEWS